MSDSENELLTLGGVIATRDSRWRFLFTLLACGPLSVLVGCGAGQVDCIPLSGTVRFQGKPVPKGAIWFEPEASVGLLAPTGFATIENGRYRTVADYSPVGGQYLVRIKGYDGTAPTAQDAREMLPGQIFLGQPLFSEYTRAVTLSKGRPTLDIDVDGR